MNMLRRRPPAYQCQASDTRCCHLRLPAVTFPTVVQLSDGSWDCGKACPSGSVPINGGTAHQPHALCQVLDAGQVMFGEHQPDWRVKRCRVWMLQGAAYGPCAFTPSSPPASRTPPGCPSAGTKSPDTGGACTYASTTVSALTGIPPAYACGCAPSGAPGLTWQAGACPAGSMPVATPNHVCRVTTPDGTDLAMGWLAGQTCYFPKQAWTADGKAAGFGGTLGMSQLCYTSGVLAGQMLCIGSGAAHAIGGVPGARLRSSTPCDASHQPATSSGCRWKQ